MHKSAMLNTRIEPDLKRKAEKVLHRIGMSNAEAIRLFYNQICLHQGLPFAIKIPNKKTLGAIHAADSGNTYKSNSIDDLFNNLD